MAKRRKLFSRSLLSASQIRLRPEVPLLLILLVSALEFQGPQSKVLSLMMMNTNCLSGSPSCNCSWKSGKFVANCSSQSLTQVPNNDYFDFLLANAGNNQMPTLNRDIQQLDLGSNSITNLEENEFLVKKFKNLQKIYLNTNQLLRVHSSAFTKLTGLVELDLSENLISDLGDYHEQQQQTKEEDNEQTTPEKKVSKEKTTEKKERKKKKKKLTFLSQLTQLRQLNLASNQLTKLEEFAFSPAKQLRQLYLSRNKISFIDKRAFDGLNVLNILHLDGNKLSYLNGEILAQLPQLHSLQLAGSNSWICDCHLRKLVRQLMGNSRDGDALVKEKTSNKQVTILEDEPLCLRTGDLVAGDANGSKLFMTSKPDSSGVSSVVASLESSGGQQQMGGKKETSPKEEDSRWADSSWTNMKLDQLECQPRLQLLQESPPPQTTRIEPYISMEILMDSSAAAAAAEEPTEKGQNVNKIDKTTNQKKDDTLEVDGKHFLLSETMPTIRHHYLADELVQLTCSFELNDELDLDYSQLEWWLITDVHHHHHHHHQAASSASAKRKKVASLIWRSSPKKQSERTIVTTLKDEPGAGRSIIMDYVTRARATPSSATSMPTQLITQREAPMNQSQPGRLRRRRRLVRVSHLIADAAKIATGGNNRPLKQDDDQQKQQQQQQQQHQHQEESKRKTTMRPETAELVCRITNQAGHAELLHSLLIDSNNRQAQLEAHARQLAQDSWLRRWKNNNGATSRLLAGNSIQPAWPLDKAKARIVEEQQLEDDEPPNDSEVLYDEQQQADGQELVEQPLFIPLYLSRELLDAVPMSGNFTNHSKEIDFDDLDTDDVAARSLNQQQSDSHQRQATRQTNATTSLAPATALLASTGPNNLTANSMTARIASRVTYRQKLQSKALALIGRFTAAGLDSNESEFVVATAAAAAGGGGGDGLSEFYLGSNYGARDRHEDSSGRAKLWLRSVYTRYLDRWLHFAIGEAPLLLGICAGLFIGCLLTTFFILRLHCAKQRRIRDLDSCTEGVKQQQLKSSCPSDSLATDSYAEINSPADEDDDDDDDAGAIEGKKHQPTSGSSSGTTTTTATTNDQRELISIPSPDEFVARKMVGELTLHSSNQSTADGAMRQTTRENLANRFQSRNQYSSTLDCSRPLRYQHAAHLDAAAHHGLIVVSPEQEMQELILSPYLPMADERHALVQQQQPYSYGSDLCHQLGQQVTSSWQSPFGVYQETAASSSSRSTTFQSASHQQPELMMTAPSKLHSIEALDSFYQNPRLHNSSSLSRNSTGRDGPAYGQVSRVTRPNCGYASSSSLVTSPAASTSSTSMTSGNPMAATQQQHQQHAMYTCNHNHEPKQSDHHQHQQNHIIYLDDALRLLHSSMNDCLG